MVAINVKKKLKKIYKNVLSSQKKCDIFLYEIVILFIFNFNKDH